MNGVATSSRPSPVAESPTVSVVIASSTAGPRLQAVMERLLGERLESTAIECVIAVPDVATVVERAHTCCRQFDERLVRVVPVTAASVPALYAAGLQAARGTCVAMTNDRFVPSRGWLAAALSRSTQMASAPATMVAGVIEPPAQASIIDRAVYYMEYGPFAPQADADGAAEATGAAGANVMYSAAALAQLRPLTDPPAWEYFWHEALAARGVVLTRDDAMRVRMVYRWTLGQAWRERYDYARAFAAERARPLGQGVRLLRGLMSLLLPPVLLVRLFRQHARHGWLFLSAAPLIGLLTLPWAWGEAMGMWAGGDDGLRRVSLG